MQEIGTIGSSADDQVRGAADQAATFSYQPILGLAHGDVRAVEALYRPAGTAPAPMLEAAGERRAAIERALLAAAVAEAGPTCRRSGIALAVNLSPVALGDAATVALVADLLQRHDLDGIDLWVELSGPGAMDDAAVAGLQGIVALGIAIVLDDRCTGFAAVTEADRLARVVELAAVKVALRATGSGIHLAAASSFAQERRVALIVERIEDRGGLELARLAGAEAAQGRYLAADGPLAAAVTAGAGRPG
jgi:EAL domain-containing protein (putative c-di-GMP-specific phosphodiesterase class I)